MPTYIKAGLYKPPFTKDEGEYEIPEVYIDSDMFQILNDNEEMVIQLTYEELRGIMAIMAAEQEKKHLYIRARADKN